MQRKVESKIEDIELTKLKLLEKLKDSDKNTEFMKVLDLAFEVMSDPHYIWKNGTVDQKQMLLKLLFSKKIPIEFSTRTYGTLPFSSLFLYTGDIFDCSSSHLETIGRTLNKDVLHTVKFDSRTGMSLLHFYANEFNQRDYVLSQLTEKQKVMYRFK